MNDRIPIHILVAVHSEYDESYMRAEIPCAVVLRGGISMSARGFCVLLVRLGVVFCVMGQFDFKDDYAHDKRNPLIFC